MLTIEDARQQFIDTAKQYAIQGTEFIDIENALGRVIANDIISDIDVPPADNSAMDGYAICCNDTKKIKTLPVSQIIAAGHTSKPLEAGTAARIFTGAEIPKGADTVIMQELCTTTRQHVNLPEDIKADNNIRRRGQDIQRGEIIFQAGHCLEPQDIGLIASIGIKTIEVYRKLRVAIISSGDELCEPGEPLSCGKIYNSNRYLLQGFLARINIECIDVGVIEDTLDKTKAALTTAAKTADCIISTGGVSVGDEDHIKDAIKSLGEINLWRIAIKPGKPVALGAINGEKNGENKRTPIMGLPGNPASVFITFLLFAKPFLDKLQHKTYIVPKGYQAKSNFSSKCNLKREEYLRARINLSGKVDIYPNQSSGVLSSACWANGLAVKPAGQDIAHNDMITYIPFYEFLN